MNIEMFFVYPTMGIINNESNLFRIVDNNLKETIVIYLTEEKNKYNIYMINTMTGNIYKIFTVKGLAQVDKFNNLLINNKVNIVKSKDLDEIVQYILKLIKN